MSEIFFIALSNEANPEVHTATIKTPSYDLTVIVVPDYFTAVNVAKESKENGAKFIELCGGFGHEGVSLVKKAVPGVHVGVVRFDIHPGMNNQSGDVTYG